MKKFAQLILILLIVVISVFFYNKYFRVNVVSEIESKIEPIVETNEENNSIGVKNNLIKNLKYDVNLENNTKYNISSDLSEIIYIENIEYVRMQNVIAVFIDKNNIPIIIKAKKALFNNSTYNTKFDQNVEITYLDNLINSDELDLNFNENIASIYNNVVYEGNHGRIKTDNIVINLITKKIDIFMNNKKNKVKIISNR
jgi:lipopolysaccharide assembly outer membrane protein LptD (OstA)